MSLSIEKLIFDAKKLSGNLKEKELLADQLLIDTECINDQIYTMSRFQEDLNILNTREKSNHEIITLINNESPQIREIQQENRQLKANIEETAKVLEIIMNKYRLHTMSQLNETKHNFDILAKSHENHNCVKIITAQSEKIKEMAAVMQAVLQKEDMQVDQINQIMTGLQTENAGLRELLGITTKMDNYLTFTENSTQTDELENKEPMNEDKMEN